MLGTRPERRAARRATEAKVRDLRVKAIGELQRHGMSRVDICLGLKISTATYYRYLRLLPTEPCCRGVTYTGLLPMEDKPSQAIEQRSQLFQ